MILLLVLVFLVDVVCPFGPTAEVKAREATETEGERDRSMGVLFSDMTEDGREIPPSLTPPPRTVTLPPSYGVTVGVGVALGASLHGVALTSLGMGGVKERSRRVGPVGVGDLLLFSCSKGGPTDGAREFGVKS